VLDFDDVCTKLEAMMEWLAGVYVNAMNVIHYMHDKYAYERIEMALHDYAPLRTMAFGMAGLSVVADSLSAIKYAKVRVVRDDTGLVDGLQDRRGVPTVRQQRQPRRPPGLVGREHVHEQAPEVPHLSRRGPHQSILTITSNVVYGKATGNTPDGRKQGERSRRAPTRCMAADSQRPPRRGGFGRQDPVPRRRRRISLTTSIVPGGLGRVAEDRIANLTGMLDAFFGSTGYHMNVNVLNRETLTDAMDHPEKYPHLTIRVSATRSTSCG